MYLCNSIEKTFYFLLQKINKFVCLSSCKNNPYSIKNLSFLCNLKENVFWISKFGAYIDNMYMYVYTFSKKIEVYKCVFNFV